MEGEITALKVQKKNPQRVDVYLDGEFAFGLARIVAAWLKVGQILSENEVDRLRVQDAREVVYQYALRLLNYRPRTEKEVEQKLKDKGCSPELISATLERLRQSSLLNDEQFAQGWVESRAVFHPRSQRVMRMELRQKGVAEDVIDRTLDGAADEDSLAYQAAQRRAQRLAGTDWPDFRNKLIQFLARRGFSYATISPVVRRLWDEAHAKEDQVTLNTDDEG